MSLAGEEVLATLMLNVECLNHAHTVQVSIDGPTISWKAFDLLQFPGL